MENKTLLNNEQKNIKCQASKIVFMFMLQRGERK